MTYLKEINLKNFRNFSHKKISFSNNLTQIIGDNGQGKTNILEAIALLTGNDFLGINFNYLINNNEDIFFIEADVNGLTVAISFDKEQNKKTYLISGKKTTKSKFESQTLKSVIFDPTFMNIMYFSPTQRRDYIDSLLSNTFPGYKKLLIMYKNTVKSRNKLLKNISIGKSNIDEITFWDNEFVKQAIEIYKYRFYLVKYIKNQIPNFKDFFLGKIDNIDFEYISKVNIKSIESDLKTYLIDNIHKDIILGTTRIGPHIDDFSIIIDKVPVKDFSSRGEMKTILIGLKLIELNFLEDNTKQKPILLLDDLYSELDEKHKDILVKYILKYQTIITSITPITKEEVNTIKL